MATVRDTKYIVYDTESVADGELMRRVLYSGERMSAARAIERYRSEREDPDAFIPVTFHVPVAIALARVGEDFRIQDLTCLDAPKFDPVSMVELFWRGVQVYRDAALVDFNGRGFDLPLLSLAAFRYGVSCPAYFDDDRFGFRYRFTSKHIDLMEWMTEYGAYRVTGGLNLLAKILGKPGKMDTRGDQVESLFAAGKIHEINDYCLHDVLDTYFVFLRTRVMGGQLSLDAEQSLVAETRGWLADKAVEVPALTKYLDAFGSWQPQPFS